VEIPDPRFFESWQDWVARLIEVQESTPEATSGGGSTIVIREVDGVPSVVADTLVLPNGTLTFVGAVATYTPTGGAGTVTSVGLALPVSVFSIAGSPVIGAGTLTGTFIVQTAGTVFAGPVGGAPAVPTFRVLTAAEVTVADAGNWFTGTEVETVLQELGALTVWRHTLYGGL
jgi:hypothetical protein